MNSTKKITTGAMLLAIVGALMLIDRQLSYMFETFIIMFMPITIIIYATMYEIKDGLLLAFCLLVLTFILGNPEYAFVNVPIGLIVGIGYSLGIKKGLDKKKLMIIAMFLFIVGEVIVAFIVTPLLGISIAQQIESIKELYNEMLVSTGATVESFGLSGINFDNLLLILLVISTILLGVMEGFVIHILSLFLLQRFNIKTIDKGNIISFNLHPAVAYVSFISFAIAQLFIGKIDNETIKLIIISIGSIGSIILLYYGYIFLIFYLKASSNNKFIGVIAIIVILLTMPISLFVLIIFGFLYGAGPLKRVLAKKGLQ